MSFKKFLLGAGAVVALSASAAQADVLFWSTQAKPVEETQAMRDQVLSGAGQVVDYQANDGGPFLTRLQAELQAGTGTIGAAGRAARRFRGDGCGRSGGHVRDWTRLASTPLSLNWASLAPTRSTTCPGCRPPTSWRPTSKALEYLPEGADINALTYDQLIAWAANVQEATGEAKFGFPAGPDGLKHRFFQGYLYPSYTNGVVRTFKSDDAVAAWEEVPRTVEPHQPRLDQLLVHAGTTADRRSLDRVRPLVTPGRCLQRAPGRFRRLPGARRPDRAWLHARALQVSPFRAPRRTWTPPRRCWPT